MIAVSVRQSVSLSVTRFNSTSLCKKAEQIRMNTFGSPWNIVLDEGSDPPERGGVGVLGEILSIVNPLHIS